MKMLAARAAVRAGALAAALLAGVLAAAAPTAAQNEDGADAYDAATVLATVGDVDVTLGDLIRARQALDPQLQNLPPEALFQGLLDQRIAELLFEQAALADGLAERPEVVEALAAARRQVLALAYRDAALREVYESDVAGGQLAVEVELSQILLQTEEDALAVKAELEGGADFAALAQERSTGPAAAAGGSLGAFPASQLPEELANPISALEPGDISEPIQTSFGWHVFRLDDRRAGAPPPFELWLQSLDQATYGAAIDAAMADAETAIAVERATETPPASAITEDALIAQ